jgi:hypothetical protein
LSLDRVRIDENLNYEVKCKLVDLMHTYKYHFLTRLGRWNSFEYRFQMKADCVNRETVDLYHYHYGVKTGNKSKR